MSARPGWILFIKWIVANMVGMAIVSVVLVSMKLPEEICWDLVGLIVLGLTLGITQWFVLRGYIQKASSWILATTFGFLLGLGIGRTIEFIKSQSTPDLSVASVILFVIYTGSFLFGPGIAQWLILRHQVEQARLWILALANTIGLVIGLLPAVNSAGSAIGVVGAGITGTLGGGIYGIITGAVLVRLLQNPLSQRAALPQSMSNNVTIKATRSSPAGVFGFLRSERKRREVASRLQRIQSEISRLQSEYETLSKRNQVPLTRRDQLEVEISRLVQLDTANLRLRVDDDRKKASRLSREQLHEREKQLDQELQNIERAKREAQRQLGSLEREVEASKARRREIEGRLQQSERDDPANLGVVFRRLRENWEGMSEAELEKQIVKGDIEPLYREQRLLEHRIQKASEEADERRRFIEDPIAKAVLLLEKHTLERENLERDFQRDLSRHSEINTLLQSLQPEYRELEQLNRNLIVATYRERRIARVITWIVTICMLILIVVAIVTGIHAYQAYQKEHKYQQALVAIEAGKWVEAQEALTEIISSDSDYKDAQNLLCESYYRPARAALDAGEWSIARDELQLASSNPSCEDTQALLCDSYYRPAKAALDVGRWDIARDELQQLAASNVNCGEILCEGYYQLAFAAIQENQWEIASDAVIDVGTNYLFCKDLKDLIVVTYAPINQDYPYTNWKKEVDPQIEVNLGRFIQDSLGLEMRWIGEPVGYYDTGYLSIADYIKYGKNLWVIGSCYIFHSSDGGITWEIKRRPGDEPFIGSFSIEFCPFIVYFSNESEGWFGTTDGLLYTQDGGITWEFRQGYCEVSHIDWYLFYGNQHIEADCAYGPNSNSSDGGKTWH